MIVKVQHVFLSPLVILAVPPLALLDQNILLAKVLSTFF